MRPVALLTLLALAACASPDPATKAMIGADESTLVAAMGRPPDLSVETAPGTRHLQWRKQAAFAISNSTVGYSYSGATIRPIPNSTASMVREQCATEWTVENGIATDYRRLGDCLSLSR
jgi:hypothetical protein